MNVPKQCQLVFLVEIRFREGKALGSDGEKTRHGMSCGYSAEKGSEQCLYCFKPEL